MTDRQDNEDLILDRNLRGLGRQLTMPAEPTREQERSWKHRGVASGRIAGRRDRATFERGKMLMKRHRIWTVTGSAVAATIALSAAIWIMPGQTPVSATTIFQSLREATTRGLSVWIDHVRQDGIEVDGRLLMAFVSDGGPDDAGATEGLRFDEHAYVELRILADEDHPHVPGLDLELALSASPQQEWLYFRIHQVPADLMAEEPFLGLLASYAKSGVLLEMEGLMRHERKKDDAPVDRAPADDDSANRRQCFDFGIKLDSGSKASGANASLDDSEDSSSESCLSPRFKFKTMFGGVEQESASDDAAGARRTHEVDVESLMRATEILESFFRGEMTPEQLTAVIDWIESSAGSVSIDEQDGGVYLLTARDFDLSDLPIDDDSAAEVAQIELEISYRKDTGIQWAALRNVGDGNGSIRFELTDFEIDDALLDRERFTQDENVKVIDLSALADLLGISSANAPKPGLSDEDIERLKSLGYIGENDG